MIKDPSLIAEGRSFEDACMKLATFLDVLAEIGEVGEPQIPRSQFGEGFVKNVQLGPDLDTDEMAQTACVFPRGPDGLQNRIGILPVQDIKIDDCIGGRLPVPLKKGFLVAIEMHDGKPVLFSLAVAGKGLVDIQDTREVFGTLYVAGHPELVFGEA